MQNQIMNQRIVVVASKNQGKVRELRAVLAGLPFIVKSLSDYGDFVEPQETGITFQANAELKARYYAELTGQACLADDSGLEVDVLKGAPGVYSARFAGEDADDAANNAKLLALLSGITPTLRTARFRCALVYYAPDGLLLSTDGVCEGLILEAACGEGGFGYDPLFYMPEYEQTLAEMTQEQKNAISHRGAALRAMVAKLR